MQVPDRFYDKFKDADLKLRAAEPKKEDLEHTRAALAMCENIDWNVGRLLKRLDELKLAERTIVLYFSDNGPNGWRWNGGMKGRKGSTDEGGVRSPLLLRWPGTIKPGTRVTQIAAAIDLLPTLARLAGRAPRRRPAARRRQPRAAAPGQGRGRWPDRMIFCHWNGKVSVRTQRLPARRRRAAVRHGRRPGPDARCGQGHARGRGPAERRPSQPGRRTWRPA